MDIKITSIGTVSNRVSEKKDVSWGEDISQIILDEKYRGGLSGLEDFSHAVIVYYLDKANFDIEKHLTRKPQNREDMPLVGIFSQRAKDRPNRLAMTAVSIVSVEEDRLTVRGLDRVREGQRRRLEACMANWRRNRRTIRPYWGKKCFFMVRRMFFRRSRSSVSRGVALGSSFRKIWSWAAVATRTQPAWAQRSARSSSASVGREL